VGEGGSQSFPLANTRSDKQVGVDVGLKTFAYLSDGTRIENPRFIRSEEKPLAKAQRKLSQEATGSNKREKRRKVIARIY